MERRPVRTGPNTASVRLFGSRATSVMIVFTALLFAALFARTTVLIREQAREQAISYLDLVVTSRTWNADHGGVWVLKTPTSPTNPYLRELGVEPDTSTVSGTLLTLRNPAAMTNELSRIVARGEGVQFRMTSLKVVNPANAPDRWEREMLDRFREDPTEVSVIEKRADGRVLRLIRPLITNESCLRCHAAQGYRVGDVRGAISLTLPLKGNDRSIVSSGITLAAVFLAVVTVGGAVSYRLVDRISMRVADSERQLVTLAHTDALTGLDNRRTILERLGEELARAERGGHRVGVIELDVDHFKRVNDTYGHAAGDTVLREIADRIVREMREYDIAGRLGGEEFLVVSPESDPAGVAALAERLRAAVNSGPAVHGETRIEIAVSAGATLSYPGDTGESVLLRADKALYLAKETGRNRVELG